jgi:hypothetical protein
MNKKKYFVLSITGLFLFYSCGSNKKTAVSIENQIMQAFSENNNEFVMQLYDRYGDEKTKKGENKEAILADMAGQAAFRTENWLKVHQYYSPIVDTTSNVEIIGKLGISYFRANEEETEHRYWLKHLDQLKGSEYYQTATTRLFDIETKKENYEAALNVWEKIPEKDNPELQYEYVRALEKAGKNNEALKQSAEVLKKYPQHEKTLYWRAMYIFVKAENTYQAEMKIYNKNPNYTSYVYLRRELKPVSAEFREARDIFRQLHELNANNKTYMQYLLNCYIRLEMKSEAEKISALLKQTE